MFYELLLLESRHYAAGIMMNTRSRCALNLQYRSHANITMNSTILSFSLCVALAPRCASLPQGQGPHCVAKLFLPYARMCTQQHVNVAQRSQMIFRTAEWRSSERRCNLHTCSTAKRYPLFHFLTLYSGQPDKQIAALPGPHAALPMACSLRYQAAATGQSESSGNIASVFFKPRRAPHSRQADLRNAERHS